MQPDVRLSHKQTPEPPGDVCSAPSCPVSTPMSALPDTERALLWRKINNLAAWRTQNNRLLAVNETKELIVDFRKRKKGSKTHTSGADTSRTGVVRARLRTGRLHSGWLKLPRTSVFLHWASVILKFGAYAEHMGRVKDDTHQSHSMFALLPSGQWHSWYPLPHHQTYRASSTVHHK